MESIIQKFNKLKILYVTNQFYLHGGIEKMLSQKINYFIEEYGYEVILCTSEHYKNEYVYPLNNKTKHIDLEINYSRTKSYFHPKNLLKVVRHFRKLKQTLKIEQPDIVISVNFTPEQYFLPFIEKHIPKIKEFHSSGVTIKKSKSLLGRFKGSLFDIFERYDSLIVLNKDEVKYYPFKNVQVIPNFIEVEKGLEIENRNKTIIAAGRIAPVKQFDHLIQAWGLIANQFPDWDVKIFGDGDDELSKKLHEQLLQNNIPRIKLMGATTQLTLEMQKASIYAMTSITECFPMVLLEAQNAGLPIVSYNCPNGPRNIINNNEDGVLVQNQSIDDFANALSNLINEKNVRLKMGIKAKNNSLNFAPSLIMEMWNKLMLNLR